MQLPEDEGIHRGVVDRLRNAGHQLSYIAELAPGAPDADVLDRANRNSEVLVTEDKDFGELVFRQNLTNRGVILLRMYGFSASDQAAALLDFLTMHGERDLVIHLRQADALEPAIGTLRGDDRALPPGWRAAHAESLLAIPVDLPKRLLQRYGVL